MSNGLNPCPYCGYSRASLVDDHMLGGFFVFCPSCDMSGPRGESQLEAENAWNTLISPFKWTSEPPKVPGWYFTRKDAHGYPVRVVFVKEEDRFSRKLKKGGMFFTMARTEEDESYIIDDFIQDDWKWAGPIPEPKKKAE